MYRYIAFLAALVISGNIFSQTITIQEARQLGAGKTVTVHGIVTNGSELGLIRYFQDETGGLAAYSSLTGDLNPGDEITVTGTLKDYSNLLELDPVTSVTVNSTDNDLPVPVILTPGELSDTYEGQLVQIREATFDDAGTPIVGKTNYAFTADGESSEIRISTTDSPFVGMPLPSGFVTITGIMSQYLSYNQILVRGLEDIMPESPINLTSPVAVSNLSKTGFDLSWETDVSGTTEAFIGNTPDMEIGAIGGTVSGTGHSVSISGAVASELFYVQPFSVLDQDTTKAPVGVYITVSESSGKMQAYFNRAPDLSVSTGTNAIQLDRAIDDTLIAYINRATESIDIAIYNFNNTGISNITTALNAAYDRGVNIRVVYDSNIDASGVQGLNAAIGTMASPISNYPVYGIMHDKFVIIDAYADDPDLPLVWTGSTNFTDGQINTDPNNVIIIQDKSLAIGYTLEFNEMFGSSGLQPDPEVSKFGPDKTDNTPHHFIIGGKEVESYFSPSDQVNSKLLDNLNTADHDLSIATMLITKTDIGYAISDKASAGVDAKVLINVKENSSETVVNTLKSALSQNFRETGESGIMHDKYMIVDEGAVNSDPLVLTGSHNWSSSADLRNDENTLVIHDATLANIYYQDFMGRFNNGLLIVDAPVLANDYITLSEGSSINIPVTENDQIPSDFTIDITGEPTNGTAQLESDHTITYTPDAGFNNNLDTISYKVCLVNNPSLCDSAFAVVLVQKPVGIPSELAGNVMVYPNPTSGYINVRIDNPQVTVKSIGITDISGRVILNRTDVYAGYPVRFSTENLVNGVYFVRIETSEGTINKKIVVRK
jgi:phosphatidylserine/phosphatidylglycerophosphate/cardiolipin synthase-like enzyme